MVLDCIRITENFTELQRMQTEINALIYEGGSISSRPDVYAHEI